MRLPDTLAEYEEVTRYLASLDTDQCCLLSRELIRRDLYFLLRYACGRKDMEHPWLLARCKEVQEHPDDMLDLWAREHYKSTIITYGLTLKDLMASHGNDPLPEWNGLEPVIGIFSHTRGIAKGFLRQIKRELESNQILRGFFPDIIWEDVSLAPKWSEDDGLILKRKSNPKESTIEAWGLVDGQPTSKHYDIQIYDDMVTLESVRSPEMQRKTMDAWEMSINLGAGHVRRRHIGTRYHFNDAYRDIVARKGATPRIHKATVDGTPSGDPVFKSKEWVVKRHQLLGPYTFATQMLQDPLADETQGFKKEWLQFHTGDTGDTCNRYLLVDPAGEKKKTSDYTCMMVIGLGADDNYRVLDILRDRLNLIQKGDALFRLHRKWKPLATGYEKYGLQADIEYYNDRMKRENYYFPITPLGGQVAKVDRIKGLIPSFSQRRWLFPETLYRTDYQGKVQDLVDVYINEEYLSFPVSVHDDMMDCQARINDPDLKIIWPRAQHDDEHDRYSARKRNRSTSAWAS